MFQFCNGRFAMLMVGNLARGSKIFLHVFLEAFRNSLELVRVSAPPQEVMDVIADVMRCQ